eukprot:10665572-Karenia_brevis.AAC.1
MEARVRRAGFLVKLVNAPVGSLQHAALIFHTCQHSPWLTSALEDLCLIMPCARLTVEQSIHGPFVFAPSYWNDEGQ